MVLRSWCSALIELVVPPTCAGCGLPGRAICENCRAAIRPVSQPRCRRCGHPWAVDVDRCAECPRSLVAMDFAAAYRGPIPQIVNELKDGRRHRLVDDLAALVLERCLAPSAGMQLVPVPSTAEHRRSRGFDPAFSLARRLGEAWQRDVVIALRRTHGAAPQRGLSATDRVTNVRGAFAVEGCGLPSRVCLIDDVCTTGATLSACARTLRKAGAREVVAVTVARVLRTP